MYRNPMKKKLQKIRQQKTLMATYERKFILLERMRLEDACNRYIKAFLENPSSEAHEEAKKALETYLEDFNKLILPLLPPQQSGLSIK